ncbi:MAG: transglutaminase family protein [Anaerobutyricum sp.]|nr:transglutaminase family protein [Anaerobutyricum sp.]
MKQLHFIYRMHSAFSSDIMGHSFTLKCIPASNAVQQIEIVKQEIHPVEWVSSGTDSFGTPYIYGCMEKFHNSFSVEIEGFAAVDRTGKKMKMDSGQTRYIYETSLTGCSPAMKNYADIFRKKWFTDDGKPIHFKDAMFDLMEQIFHRMEYCPGITTVQTTAQEAFEDKRGVCQDYAHVMIALCRYLGIQAIYIAGFMSGEGASHAWVAVGDSTTGEWYEIDPTNNRWVDDNYISVSHGLDADDCIINKGIYRGIATESQNVTVIVEEK